MEKQFQDLPGWAFRVDEISANVYNIKGRNIVNGASLDLSGSDPEQLLERARRTALEMDRVRRASAPQADG